MAPTRGEEFLRNVANIPDFRRAFSGYFTSRSAVLVHLRAPEPKPSLFFLEKIEKVKKALDVEERWLEAARHELDQACTGDWDKVIEFDPVSQLFLHCCQQAGQGTSPG